MDHLVRALGQRPNTSVEELWPRRRMRDSRVWNAWAQAHWDLLGAAAASDGADVLVSPCNIGRAGRAQSHLLVVHDTIVLDHPKDFDPGYAIYARALFGPSVRRADVLIVPSRYTEQRVREHWPGAPPTIVAGYPLECERRDDANAEPGRLLMVGLTEANKRHALGIEAVRLARQRSGAALRLAIVGPAGRAEQEVWAAARAADPRGEWIERHGFVSQDELERHFERAWLLLAPSRSEGFGLPVGEAAARGVPAVHSGLGALSEVVPGGVEDGDDATSYCESILALLDPPKHAAAAERALQAARRRTFAAYSGSVDAALQIALSGR